MLSIEFRSAFETLKNDAIALAVRRARRRHGSNRSILFLDAKFALRIN